MVNNAELDLLKLEIRDLNNRLASLEDLVFQMNREVHDIHKLTELEDDDHK